MASRSSGRGNADTFRENFQPDPRAVVAVPTGAAASVLAGPASDGQVYVVKSFSRVINRSGAARTVSFYLVATGDTAGVTNCIGLDLSLPANQWLPFGEMYLEYGYAIHAVASGAGVQVMWNLLVED